MTEQLCVVFIPALSVALQSAETNKGSPLTESEDSKSVITRRVLQFHSTLPWIWRTNVVSGT